MLILKKVELPEELRHLWEDDPPKKKNQINRAGISNVQSLHMVKAWFHPLCTLSKVERTCALKLCIPLVLSLNLPVAICLMMDKLINLS